MFIYAELTNLRTTCRSGDPYKVLMWKIFIASRFDRKIITAIRQFPFYIGFNLNKIKIYKIYKYSRITILSKLFV